MKTNHSKALLAVASIGMAFLSGCATQPTTNAQQVAEKPSNQYATGSRLAVKNTTELIGLKTIDKENIRDSKMFTNITVDGK